MNIEEIIATVELAEEAAMAELEAFGCWEPCELRTESELLASRDYREECFASFGAMSDRAIAELGTWDEHMGWYR